MKSEDIFKKIKTLEKIRENKPAIEKDILNIHEASKRLSQSLDKAEEEKRKELADIFIHAYVAASRLGVADVAKIIEERLKESNNKIPETSK